MLGELYPSFIDQFSETKKHNYANIQGYRYRYGTRYLQKEVSVKWFCIEIFHLYCICTQDTDPGIQVGYGPKTDRYLEISYS